MKQKLLLLFVFSALSVACALAGTSPIATVAPTFTSTPLPAVATKLSATNTQINTATLTETVAPKPTSTPRPTATERLFSSSETEYWDQVIAQDPTNANAYYQRATIIYKSATPEGNLGFYASLLDQALLDIDMAISLHPEIGDYYALRQRIYFNLAVTVEYNVDSQYLIAIALDNAYKAYELGTTIEDYPDRLIIIDLIGVDRCQEALDEVQKLIDQSPPGDISVGGLLHIRSMAYACLGRLDEALQSVNDSMFNNLNMDYKNNLKLQYLLMLGQYSEALPILDRRISETTRTGYLFYMRAAVYYNLGMKNLAQADLDAGKPRTWGRGGWLPYVEAQLALDEGRTEDAIRLLQYAEATFDPTHNPMREKIREQLQVLGAEPLSLFPSVPYQATPIP